MKIIPFLHQTVAAAGSYLQNGDLTFLTDVHRLDPQGEGLKLEVEVHADWDEVWEAASVCRQINLDCGLAIQADALILLTDEERRELLNHQCVTEWKRESLETDAEARQEAAERVREGRREARYYGLCK